MKIIHEAPEIEYMPIKSNPDYRRGLFDIVAEQLWGVVLGFIAAIILMAL